MRFAPSFGLKKSATILLGSSNLLIARSTVSTSLALQSNFSTSCNRYSTLLNFCPTSLRNSQIQTNKAFSPNQQHIRKMGSDASRPDGANLPKGKSESEWRTILSPAQFKVLREAGTERAFTHEYETNDKAGVYNCAACETPLYKSATKFKSGCGWPAFFDAIPGAVKRNVDRSLGMVSCNNFTQKVDRSNIC